MYNRLIRKRALNDLHHVDSITGEEFEIYMTRVLNHAGYHNVIHTPQSHDHGVDAFSKTDSISWQFKDYDMGNTVPFHAVDEVVFGARFYGTKTNVVLTNSYFSKSTRRLVREINFKNPNSPIILIDRSRLVNLFMKYESLKPKIRAKIQRIKRKKEQQKRHKAELRAEKIAHDKEIQRERKQRLYEERVAYAKEAKQRKANKILKNILYEPSHKEKIEEEKQERHDTELKAKKIAHENEVQRKLKKQRQAKEKEIHNQKIYECYENILHHEDKILSKLYLMSPEDLAKLNPKPTPTQQSTKEYVKAPIQEHVKDEAPHKNEVSTSTTEDKDIASCLDSIVVITVALLIIFLIVKLWPMIIAILRFGIGILIFYYVVLLICRVLCWFSDF